MTAAAATPTTEAMNRGKFKELLLYVASRMLGDPSYGSVKLNKVMYFSDVLQYAAYGESITGASYIRHRLGPAPQGLTDIQQELIEAGEADLAVLRRGRRSQKILFPKRDADVSIFTGPEIETVNVVLRALKDRTAEEASDLSHQLQGWKIAREYEEIPYSTIFLYDGAPTADDLRAGAEVASRLRGDMERAGVLSAA